MSPHVIKSTVGPTAAPTSKQLGTHWVKTTDPVGHWLATNTSDDGWVSQLNTTIAANEALRRSYAEAGYNLVDGSFEAGGTVTTFSPLARLVNQKECKKAQI